jgi:hypothetical protein
MPNSVAVSSFSYGRWRQFSRCLSRSAWARQPRQGECRGGNLCFKVSVTPVPVEVIDQGGVGRKTPGCLGEGARRLANRSGSPIVIRRSWLHLHAGLLKELDHKGCLGRGVGIAVCPMALCEEHFERRVVLPGLTICA